MDGVLTWTVPLKGSEYLFLPGVTLWIVQVVTRLGRSAALYRKREAIWHLSENGNLLALQRLAAWKKQGQTTLRHLFAHFRSY